MRPYWVKITLSLTSNLLSVIFSIFSLTMVIPFLKVLFEKNVIYTHPPAFELSATAIQQYLYYFISLTIEKTGDKSSALIFVAVMVIAFTLMKNVFLYLGAYMLHYSIKYY
jgi:subfamily B ATP-binding cassette protein MsbA